MGTRRIRTEDGDLTLFYRKVSPFSNHHPADFECEKAINDDESRNFSCTEQYYMFNKASLVRDRDLMSAVLKAESPKAMKSMCSKGNLRHWSDRKWDQHKESVMYTGCLAKYRACPYLRFALFLSTGSRLVECSPFDAVWGIDGKWETGRKAIVKHRKGHRDCREDRLTDRRDEPARHYTRSNQRGTVGGVGIRVGGNETKRKRKEDCRDERAYVETRVQADEDYLRKAMKQVDLMYKERARIRYEMTKRRLCYSEDYLTREMRDLIPEWALPPPITFNEAIRASPPQITNFERTPPPARSRSLTPPLVSSRLWGRLTISDGRPVRKRQRSRSVVASRSESRETWPDLEIKRSRSRDRKRRRDDEKDRTTGNREKIVWDRSNSRSPKNRKERRAAIRKAEGPRIVSRNSEARNDDYSRERKYTVATERSRSRSSEGRRSHSKQEDHSKDLKKRRSRSYGNSHSKRNESEPRSEGSRRADDDDEVEEKERRRSRRSRSHSKSEDHSRKRKKHKKRDHSGTRSPSGEKEERKRKKHKKHRSRNHSTSSRHKHRSRHSEWKEERRRRRLERKERKEKRRRARISVSPSSRSRNTPRKEDICIVEL